MYLILLAAASLVVGSIRGEYRLPHTHVDRRAILRFDPVSAR
jgi:hypothetical protein